MLTSVDTNAHVGATAYVDALAVQSTQCGRPKEPWDAEYNFHKHSFGGCGPDRGDVLCPIRLDERLQNLSPVEEVALRVLHSPKPVVCQKQSLPGNVVACCHGERNLRNPLARGVHVARSTAK